MVFEDGRSDFLLWKRDGVVGNPIGVFENLGHTAASQIDDWPNPFGNL